MILAFPPSAEAADCAPAPISRAEPLGAEPLDGGCLFGDVGAAGRLGASFPDTGVSRGVSLPWARAELGVRSAGDAQARIVLLPLRSGGEQGYVGVAGESLVPVVQTAEARWDWRQAGLTVAGGVVDDPWVMTVQPGWAWRPLLRPMVTESAFFTRSDVGGWLSWTAPDDLVDVTVSVTSGEGFQRRERNDGVNTTVVARAHPLARSGSDLDLMLGVMGREGSYGLGQSPDHRAGAMVSVAHPWVAAGVDGLLGTGLLGDGSLRPAGASVWARSGDQTPLAAFGRVDRTTALPSAPGAASTLALLGAGLRLPPEPGAPTALVVGWEARRFGPDAAPLAGSAVLARTDTVFLHLQTRLAGALPLGGP
jgi:hypothetical protein